MKYTHRSFQRGHRHSAVYRLAALLLCVAALLSGCAGRTPEMNVADWNAQIPEPGPTELVAPAQPERDDGAIFAANPLDGMGEYAPGEGIEEEQGEQMFVPTRGEINIGLVMGGDASLNPLKCIYRDLISVNELVYESVIALDDTMQPVGELADTWTSEGNTYIFHLRSGILFHNGQALSALDVVDSWNYINTQGSSSPWYERAKLIKSMEALDDNNLRVTFNNTGVSYLYAMTFPVVQRYTLNYAIPMGTGPYWYTNYLVGSYLRLESNPFWWKKEARVHSIAGWRYAETADALQALLTGEIDSLATLSAQASLYKKLTDYTTMDYTTRTYEMLIPNLRRGALTNVRMREALMYAIDRTAIASTVYGNMVQESEVPVVPGSFLYETQAARYNYSPERALQILHELGWTDSNGDAMLDTEVDGLLENFTIKLVTYNAPTSEARTDAARLIADQLKKVGVTVEITTIDQSRLSKTLRDGEYDVALVAVNLPFEPDLMALLRSDGSLNQSGYASERMDNLLSQARKASTIDLLKSIYSQIQMQIVEELPILGLYFHSGTVISTRNIRALHGIYELNTWNGMELVELAE